MSKETEKNFKYYYKSILLHPGALITSNRGITLTTPSLKPNSKYIYFKVVEALEQESEGVYRNSYDHSQIVNVSTNIHNNEPSPTLVLTENGVITPLEWDTIID